MSEGETGSGRLIFVGSLTWFKGPNFLVEAMAHIATERPEARLTLVGDGPLRSDLEVLARRLQIAERVVFAGKVARTQIACYYQAADVCLIPSLFETFSMVACEAMYFGLPIVAARRGALPELVIDDVTGYLVEPTDAVDIARAVLRLLSDPTQAKRLGQNGRARIRSRVGAEVYLRQLSDVLAGVASAARSDL